ncbi:phosphinothricin N-acetyltransferase [gut metagenome]|uniref:Phosphinothricin N-acetyltransferase n=1 Tax=gut metagenome TaxID=749906 RepID=J9G8P2_9ZZZZ
MGRALMIALIDACRDMGLHALIACITLGNQASVALHERLGFNQVSTFRQVGMKFGEWLDIVDYELIIKHNEL